MIAIVISFSDKFNISFILVLACWLSFFIQIIFSLVCSMGSGFISDLIHFDYYIRGFLILFKSSILASTQVRVQSGLLLWASVPMTVQFPTPCKAILVCFIPLM